MVEDYEQACVFANAIRQYARRRQDKAVMLSAAKHLHAQRERPFAAAQGDKHGGESRHTECNEAARPTREILRFAQHDTS